MKEAKEINFSHDNTDSQFITKKANSTDDELSLYKERLKILLYDIQLVLFRYLQKELFADNHDKFQSWLLAQPDLMKKISDIGRRLIAQIPIEDSFDKAQVADQILAELLNDRNIRAEFEKYRPDLSMESFNYYAIDDILNKERPNKI